LSNHYAITVSNRFNALLEAQGQISVTDTYDCLIEANNTTAIEILPKKSKVRTNFDNREIKHAREKLTNVYQKHRFRPTRSTFASLASAKEDLDKAYNETLEKKSLPCNPSKRRYTQTEARYLV